MSENTVAALPFEIRQEIVDKFVQLGIDLFCRKTEGDMGTITHLYDYKEHNVSYWLYFTSQENAIPLNILEYNEIVATVYAAATNVVHRKNHHGLTVGKLKKSLEGMPDNTPVYYQRIEDSYFEKNNWTTTKFVWETANANKETIKFVEENPSEDYDIKTINGKQYQRSFSKYIYAHSAYKTTNDEGKIAFVINAHY